MNPSHSVPRGSLPLTGDLHLPEALTLAIAAGMAIVSAAGWRFSSSLYPTAASLQSFMANDVVNLLVGVPILLVALVLTRRGRLLGLLIWPGALLYVLYNYIAYLVGVPRGPASAAYGGLIVLSMYALVVLVRRIDGEGVRERLEGAVFERLCGGVLIGFGVLFGLRALGVMADAVVHGLPIAAPELGVLLADLLLSAAWIVVGLQLWRRWPPGYSLGAGMLFQAGMLFVGLIAFLLLQPVLTDVPLAWTDVVAVALMGLICWVPLALMVRGILRRDRGL